MCDGRTNELSVRVRQRQLPAWAMTPIGWRDEERSGAVRLRFEIQGPSDAPVIVFINSIGMTYEIWDGVVANLGREFRLVRYNQRGHSGSGVPPGPYSLDDLGNDLIGLLDDLEIGSDAMWTVSRWNGGDVGSGGDTPTGSPG